MDVYTPHFLVDSKSVYEITIRKENPFFKSFDVIDKSRKILVPTNNGLMAYVISLATVPSALEPPVSDKECYKTIEEMLKVVGKSTIPEARFILPSNALSITSGMVDQERYTHLSDETAFVLGEDGKVYSTRHWYGSFSHGPISGTQKHNTYQRISHIMGDYRTVEGGPDSKDRFVKIDRKQLEDIADERVSVLLDGVRTGEFEIIGIDTHLGLFPLTAKEKEELYRRYRERPSFLSNLLQKGKEAFS